MPTKVIQTDKEQIDEVKKAINDIRYAEWKKKFRWKWEQLFGKDPRKNPARTEDEIVEVRGRVPKSFFIWFGDQTGSSKAEQKMLSQCDFEEVSRGSLRRELKIGQDG